VASIARFALLAIAILIGISLVTLLAFRGAAWLRESGGSRADLSPSSFARASDVDIHFREWGPAEGQPILLVHGTAAWSQTWYQIAEQLAAKGYRVIAPDIPPFGYSARPANRDYSRAAQATRILAFADALKLDRFILAGHSFGGGATLEAAFRASERIRGLILIDIAIALGEPYRGLPGGPILRIGWLRGLVTASTFANPVMVGPGLRRFVHNPALVDDARIALYALPYSQPGTTRAYGDWVLSGLFGDETGAQSANPEEFRKFQRPVLIFWGREDRTTPLSQGEAIHALFPRSELRILDGVDHIPHVENPDFVAGWISSFALFLPD
jgi:pimeloyl-ACP methyl ester carboxylesterase